LEHIALGGRGLSLGLLAQGGLSFRVGLSRGSSLDSLLGVSPGGLCSSSSLNNSSGFLFLLLLGRKLHVIKLLPDLVEFLIILVDIEGMVNERDVLLVVGASLESPVERASQKHMAVDYAEFIMHVEFGVVVGDHFDTCLGHSLTVVSFAVHLVIVRNYTHFDTSSVSVDDGIGEIVVGDIEYTDIESLGGHINVLHDLPNVALVGEEKGVDVARLGVIQLIGEVLDMCVEIHQDFLILLTFDLGFSHFKQNLNSLVTSIIGGLGRHLFELRRQLSGIHARSGHVLGAIPDLPDVLMRFFK